MACFNGECKRMCPDTKTTIFLTVVFMAILALLGFSIYLVAKPVECVTKKSRSILETENRMYKHYYRKPPKCREVSILSYPQLAAIIETRTKVHICSGAILSKEWLLTAAHCLVLCMESTCNNFNVRVGSSYTNKDGEVYVIERFQIHPEFNSATMHNNVGLLKVRDFQLNGKNIKYAKIYSGSMQTQKWGELLGWVPYSQVDVLYRDNVLKRINLTIEPAQVCKYRMKGDFKFALMESMLCGTYSSMGGGCTTDAGGPLMRGDAVIGVAMFGQVCYSCDYHMSVLTNISYFISFIQNFTVVEEINNNEQ